MFLLVKLQKLRVSEKQYLILFCFIFILYSIPEKSFSKPKPQQAASKADLSSLCAHLLRTLENRQSEAPGQSLTHILPVINSILTHSPDCLTEGIQVNTFVLFKNALLTSI